MTEAPRPGDPPSVLIVDDDSSIVRFLANRFADIGFDVESATDGLQALMIARRRPPDFLITDVRLPKLDGLSLCESLVRTGAGRTLTIVISGCESPETESLCQDLGVSFVRKGPGLWATIEAAIAKVYPAVASRITEPEALRPQGLRLVVNRTEPR
jgi:DNA-binding response OmpR family regulator